VIFGLHAAHGDSAQSRTLELKAIVASSVHVRDQVEVLLLHAGYSIFTRPQNHAGLDTKLRVCWHVFFSQHLIEPTVHLTRNSGNRDEVRSFDKNCVTWCFDMRNAAQEPGLIVVRRALRVSVDTYKSYIGAMCRGVPHKHLEKIVQTSMSGIDASWLDLAKNVRANLSRLPTTLAKRADAVSRNWVVVQASRPTIQSNSTGPLKWMAPEQLERRKFSFRSDVWAFGCLMYECYARRTPWDGYTNAAAVHKVLSAQRMTPPKAAPPVIIFVRSQIPYALISA